MLNLETIIEKLKDRRLDAVHKATGLSKPTIMAVRDGKTTAPAYQTIKALSDYFEKREKEENQTA